MAVHFIGRQIILSNTQRIIPEGSQTYHPESQGANCRFLQRDTKRDDFSKQGTKQDNGVGYGSGTGHQMPLDREGQEDFPGSRVQLFPARFWVNLTYYFRGF